MGSSAIHTFSKWAKLAERRGATASPSKAIMPFYLERLSVAIWSAKARAVLRRGGIWSDPAGEALDAAAAVVAAD